MAAEPRIQLCSLLLGRGPLSCCVALFADEVDQGAQPGGNISPVTMSLFDQGISGVMMTSIAVSSSMAKMTATVSVESN